MLLLDQIAEQKIAEARAKGEFDHLPGRGAPLRLDDDSMVPEDLRAAWRLLKNSGFLPPEITMRREIATLGDMLAAAVTAEERERLGKRINYLLIRLKGAGHDSPALAESFYRQKLARK